MRLMMRSVVVLGATLVAILASGALAQQSRTELLPGIDLPGFDYAVQQNTTIGACQAACEDDNLCRAFTFNTEANWCFLKSGSADEVPFAAASSGRVSHGASPEEITAARQTELPFPAADLIDAARRFAAELEQTDPPPPNASYADLVAEGRAAAAEANPAAAMLNLRQALAINGNDPAVWLELAELALTQADAVAGQSEGDNSYDLGVVGTSAALNGFLASEGEAERAYGLSLLGRGLARREMWREAIATYRASIALANDPATAERLEQAVAEHGFRVVSHEVDAEAVSPRICVVFSDPLPAGDTDLTPFVMVENAPTLAVETETSQICLDGAEHGRRYEIRLRAGLPSADNETLRKDVALSVYVPDRSPFVGFANNAYVLPAGLGGGLPISSINAETAEAVIYRIGDRSIAAAVRNNVFRGTLTGYSAETVANDYGEKLWEGEVDLATGARNAMTTTALPVADVLAGVAPGAYVITARVKDSKSEYWDEIATQWFIVTDLGLTTIAGEDGVHAFVRSLTSAESVADASLRLVAVNNEILGEGRSDAQGRFDFAPGLARGTGGRAPQLLVAETAAGDYAFLDVSQTAFDLTDRGVEGRPSPGPLDLFATTERGVYRPGETVFLTALLRDNHADAVKDLPLTLEVERPDGVIASRQLLSDGGSGSYHQALPLAAEAMRGSWHLRLLADPKAEPLANIAFLVEDFEPERLAFEVTAPEGPVAPGETAAIDVAARYLYGATAPDLKLEADLVLRPRTTLPAFPGYQFGRLDDAIETDRRPLGVIATTGIDGTAAAELAIPELPVTTKPLEAQLLFRLVDTNGRPVERSLTRPVRAATNLIGIKPLFGTGDLPEGSEARFDILVVGPDGEPVAATDLQWTLSRIETSYQWYRDGSTWKWEAISTSREVANGELDTPVDGPATIAAPVASGRYQLDIDSRGPGATASSYGFYAGYYYAEAGSDTPDTLQVALDKPAYRAGDTATLRLEPQFAGTALVMVVDQGIIDMLAVPVPAEGTSVSLPVTEAWGPGAYVTAILYRPSDAAEKRMPARALGLAYADVDPGDRVLDVSIEAPEVTLPRQPVTARIKLGNVAPGSTAYVAVAAVDLGILNLTNFATPDPDGWYFGQRQLGVAFRDLYGQLIDPMQGLPGAMRSGGDGAGVRLGTPPPTSVLVALHSGTVQVDGDGVAEVTFDLPDFAGTVRLMAMAWTDTALGHAQADVVVRDAVVTTLSPPRFLRDGDTSRLLLEINNIEGAAGTYALAISTGEGLVAQLPQPDVTLATGERVALEVALSGTKIGDFPLELTITAPDGTTQTKLLTLGVRATSNPATTRNLLPLEAGATLVLDAGDFNGLLPGTGELTLAVGPIARLDVPSLLAQLDRYPYGCSEQVTSRAMPLLYLNNTASMLGLGNDTELDERIRGAIRSLLANQNSGGAFGLWGAYDTTDLWLDAYVTDFLLRAKAQGFAVPEQSLEMALDNLANQVAYASEFTDGGEGIAYALHDLARAGRAAIGDLRYYAEARLDAFATPLAKAQLGAALALYGDQTRAAAAFLAATDALAGGDDRTGYRPDYGSQLRDTAAVLTLVAEFAPAGVDPSALAARLSKQRNTAQYTSTQEDAWTLLAAAALADQTGASSITLAGEPLAGDIYRRWSQEELSESPVELSNTGTTPTEAMVAVTGVPAVAPPASENGFSLNRQYFRPDGTPVDPTATPIAQNEQLVVVLTVTPTTLGSGQYLVVDPLPAGFEIENPRLTGGEGVADFAWLEVATPAHVEARTDQYVAAFRYWSEAPEFSTAYLVRAVTPGQFALPGATVEDMYRPELRANGGAGSLEVVPAGP